MGVGGEVIGVPAGGDAAGSRRRTGELLTALAAAA